MKKVVVGLLALVLVFVLGIFLFNKPGDYKTVKVSEVTHSVFYAPFYVALENGYFEDEGIDIDLILTPGADKVTAAVLSGDVEIGLCGSEATIYIYEGGEKDYLINFSGLTKKDGSFIVSRKKFDNFKLEDMKNTYVVGGRAGGMPEMTLEYALKINGIDPLNDLKIDTSIAFAAMQGAFIGGTGDFVTLFEPNALGVEKEGLGYVVASVGELAGTVPYTTFNAKKSYIEDNKDVIVGFEKAIQRGLDFVKEESDEDVAEAILNQFPDTSLNDLVKIVARYKSIDSWYSTTNVSEKDFYRVLEIMGKEKDKNLYEKLFK